MYCPSVLFVMPDYMIDRLQKLQNNAMRFILRMSYDTSTNIMLRNLKWLSIRQKLYFFTMLFIFNIKNNNLPYYLYNNLLYNRNVHSVNTRNKNDFRLPFLRTNSDQQNLFYKGLKCFNELPNDIKSCNTLNEFKKKLHKHCLTLPIR